MKNITLSISREKVYDEVSKTTSYTGIKMQSDSDAYKRISTTDYDREMLDRFWDEACNGATEEFKRFIVSIMSEQDYNVTLELSEMFDERLKSSMESSLLSYFVSYVISKWFKFTNRADSETYEKEAVTSMLDVKSKMFYRKKPKRKSVE